MWMPVFETLPAPEWFGTGAKLAYIVGVRMVGTVLANVLVWASSPFYEPYKSGGSHYGIGPLADQQLAGGIMLLYDSRAHARRHRLAVPADGAGGRGAAAADRAGARRARRAPRRPLRPLARARG